MNFLNPFFLVGLAAVGIPLVIHLINLRKPERIAFSTTAFLEELRKSTIRRLRIRDYLLLALRILAIIFFVLALAGPFLPGQWAGSASSDEPVVYAVMLDNSPSMGQIDKNGPYEVQAKNLLRQFIQHARKQDRFLMVNTNGELSNSNILDRDAALQWLDQVKIENSGDFIKERLDRIYRDLKGRPDVRQMGIWVTDAQQTVMHEAIPEWRKQNARYDLKWRFFKIGEKAQDNMAISNISLKSSIISRNHPFTLQVSVRNFGEHPVENAFLSLQIGKKILGQYQVKLNAEGSGQYLFEVSPGDGDYTRGVCILEGDPFGFDNKRYFSVHLPAHKRILLVQPSPGPDKEHAEYLANALNAARETGSAVTIKTVLPGQLTDQDWNNADAIILNGLRTIPAYLSDPLKNYVQYGHGLVIYPSPRADIASYNKFLSSLGIGQVSGIRGVWGAFKQVGRFQAVHGGHPVLNEIFDLKKNERIHIREPRLFCYWVFSPAENGNTHTIISSDLREPLLLEGQYGKGKILLSLIGNDPGWSDYVSNPLYAPVQYRTALYAASLHEGGLRTYTMGRPFVSLLNARVNDVAIEMNGRTIHPEVIPVRQGTRIRYSAEAWTPGWAVVRYGGKKKYIAVNPDIIESDFATLDIKELHAKLNDLLYNNGIVDVSRAGPAGVDRAIEAAGYGREIWYWFLWPGLLTLLAESVISKRYKI